MNPASKESHRLPFQNSITKKADHPLELKHSDVCGKIGAESLTGEEYLLMITLDMCRFIS